MKLGWFEMDKGKTRGLLEKAKNGYRLVVESPELKKLIVAVNDIRQGDAKPKFETVTF